MAESGNLSATRSALVKLKSIAPTIAFPQIRTDHFEEEVSGASFASNLHFYFLIMQVSMFLKAGP